MIVRMGLVDKRKDMTVEQFGRHWEVVHGTMARDIPNLLKYLQSHITSKQQIGSKVKRGPYDFDGFSQLYFADNYSMQQGFNKETELSKELNADIGLFSSHTYLIVAFPKVVKSLEKGKKYVKWMSVMKRRSDVTPEEFHKQWLEINAAMVSDMPEVKAYTQNLIIDRLEAGQSVAYDNIPIDGISEMWFEDNEKLETFFASDDGKKLLEHSETYISEETTFLVDTRVIKE